MAARMSSFRGSAHAARYLQTYDRVVKTYWPVPHDEHDVPGHYGTTRVRISGDGDAVPLLLVHPTTGSSVGWYPLIAGLCKNRRVYTPDTIGSAGRSVQTRPIDSGADLARWLDEVLDRLDLDLVHIAGYSEGGWIAGLLAASTRRPDRLSTLTLIEPAGTLERVPARFIAGMILHGMRVLTARDKSRAVRQLNQWMNGDVELTAAQIELLEAAMGSFRQRLPKPQRLSDEELRRITAPTLLVIGADTKLYDPQRARERALALLPDVEVDMVPDAGHGVAFQHPHLVTARILSHLQAADDQE